MTTIVINSPKHGIFKILIDDEDFERVNQYRWCISKKSNNLFYAVRYKMIKKERSSQLLHRFIIGDECDGMLVDHINRNTLDNRKCNLRVCNQSENQSNRLKPKNNTSGYKGVSYCKKSKKYRSTINKKLIGYFTTIEEAMIAYDNAAIEIHKDFALLNGDLNG